MRGKKTSTKHNNSEIEEPDLSYSVKYTILLLSISVLLCTLFLVGLKNKTVQQKLILYSIIAIEIISILVYKILNKKFLSLVISYFLLLCLALISITFFNSITIYALTTLSLLLSLTILQPYYKFRIIILLLYIITSIVSIIAFKLEINTNFLLTSIFLVIIAAVVFSYSKKANKNRKSDAKKMVELDNNNTKNSDTIKELSHQLRTSLNTILISSNLIIKENLNDNEKSLIETIQSSAYGIVNIIDKITKNQSNWLLNNVTSRKDIKLYDFLNEIIANILDDENTPTKFNIDISKKIPQYLSTDPLVFKYILENIFETIFQRKNKKIPELRIFLSEIDKKEDVINVKFLIECPVSILTSQDEKDKIDSANNGTEKSNTIINILKLSTIKELITNYSGYLTSEISNSDLKINFSYPFHYTMNIHEKTESSLSEKTPEIMNSFLYEKEILLVEDNLINQRIMILSLNKVVRKIEVANNGKEAMLLFEKKKFDIILMDLQMPIMDGFTTTKKIREIENSIGTHTPIIAVTANALLGDRDKCIEAGMDDYISKPFKIDVLIQKMTQLIASNK